MLTQIFIYESETAPLLETRTPGLSLQHRAIAIVDEQSSRSLLKPTFLLITAAYLPFANSDDMFVTKTRSYIRDDIEKDEHNTLKKREYARIEPGHCLT